ncbi:MAG TPA: ModE family transcriptional regulator [Acidocella sp.]|nr:ModE family transcriptional regulator [Acidocella sp.]
MNTDSQRLDLTLRLRVLRGGDVVMGPGRADLLGHIEATGSIAAGGRRMNMSYKRAWALVEAMNATFNAPLVEAVKGGVGGGGARLTATGIQVLSAYRGLERSIVRSGAEFLVELETALAVPPEVKDR